VSGTPELNYSVISPEDPTTINIFLSKVLETLPEDRKPVILGDFLDNMIPNMSEELFYKYYSDLASRVKISNHTAVFIVNADIHHEIDISVVKRFADVIIENREREERGKLIREIRVSNRVDNIHTNWEKY
jgi:KaiC/GvpD/RAD55 family RecA-like ATPase